MIIKGWRGGGLLQNLTAKGGLIREGGLIQLLQYLWGVHVLNMWRHGGLVVSALDF